MRDETLQAVLQLNRSYEALAFCSTRRAIILFVNGKADIIEDRGREIYEGIPFPLVIRLTEQAKIPYKAQTLSRKNILLRDRNICQYCGKKFQAHNLTLDHIIPKSRGGKNVWDNLVACCQKCNRTKADRTPEEAGMTLLHKPRMASIHTPRFILRNLGSDDEKWKRYLFFDSSHHSNVFQDS